MLVLVQQGQLVDQDGSECEPSSVDQPLGGHLALPVEDALELPVEVLYGPRAQLVEDAPNPRSGIGARVRSSMPRSHQDTPLALAQFAHLGGVV
jgi:hypothetical protein